MTVKGQKVLEEAMSLPEDERADLAAALIESLDGTADEGVEEAWAQEIERRVHEVESGAVETVPWSEARKRILTLRDARKRA
jgi:putative addiction module component (TIGR02574 family)